MNEPTMDKLVQRLDRLERQNRWLMRIGALVVVGITAVVLMGQARPSKVAKVIEAEKFVLLDTNGMVRGKLAIGGDGASGLLLYDGNGIRRVTLSASTNYISGLGLNDTSGKRRAGLSVHPGGYLSLTFADRNEIQRAVMGVMPNGASGLTFSDKEGKIIWKSP